MKATLRALSLGNFAIGTGAFVVPGLLGPLADGLAVPVVMAGQLLTIYALSYAVGSPVLISLTSRLPRRGVLLAGIGVFALANLMASAATSFWLLALARIAAAVGAAVFTPTASAVAVMTAPPDGRGKALATVFFGLGLSQVLGIPAGTLVAFALGWRATFVLVAAAALIAAATLARLVPPGLEGQRIGLGALGRVLKDGRIALALSVTLLQFVGQFVPYSYIGPWLHLSLGLSAGGISGLLWLYGLCSTCGGLLGGWSADRIGIVPTLLAILGALGLGLLGVSAAAGSMAGTVAALGLWGLAGFAFNAPQQARLVNLAPEALGLVLSLNASALYVGTALGGALGGLVIAQAGMDALGWVGGGFVLAAIASLVASARLGASTRRTVPG
jgi:predicted MFS family arabinose efflux permease